MKEWATSPSTSCTTAWRQFYSVIISGFTSPTRSIRSRTRVHAPNGFTFVEAYLATLECTFTICAQPLLLLQQRYGPRVHRPRTRVASQWAWRGGPYGANESQQEAESITCNQWRRLHAQEIAFTTSGRRLQALIAVYDNCNSLPTNAYDESHHSPLPRKCAPQPCDPADHQPRVGLAKNVTPIRRIHHRRV